MPRSLEWLTARVLGDRARYAALVRGAEPSMVRQPRVHRFATVPVVGAADSPAAPIAVCVAPGEGDARATRASLERQTTPPADVLEGRLGRALAESRAPWVLLVQAGDRLSRLALERLGQAGALAPDAAVITADDDLALRTGRRVDPRLRPGPSPDLWVARNPDFALLAVAREPALASLEGDDRSPYGLFLRLSGADGAGHAHVPLILCHRAWRKRSHDDDADSRAVARALADWGQPARVESATSGRRLRRPLDGEPAVDVIIPFRDRSELLGRCARSLLERSSYERFGVRLLDNGSIDSGLPPLLERLSKDSRVTVEHDPRPFNFSALNNATARRSAADVLVFLNNDTEVITPEWLEILLEQALRPEVGAVAPLLQLPDGRVQHAGAAVGLHGWAGHPFAGLAPRRRTPFGAADDGVRNWLAVSAACLMVEKRKLDEIGGFDESFVVGGGDVDLCLRLTAAGYRSLCVPHARLLHEESASRDPSSVPPGDFEASRRSYGAFRTVGDPFYHPALTLEDTTCRLRAPDEPLAAP